MATVASITHDYKLPTELLDRVSRGTLAVVSEDWEKKTVEFCVPGRRSEDEAGRTTTYSVVWIHPDFNDQFCHYFTEKPGDSPNFYVSRDTTELGDDLLEIDTTDELIAWLDDTA